MNAKSIFKSLGVNIGEAEGYLLLDSIPILKHLLLELGHVRQLLKQLGNKNPDVRESRHKTRQTAYDIMSAVDDYVSTSGFLTKPNNSTFYNKMWESIARVSITLKIVGLSIRIQNIIDSLKALVTKKAERLRELSIVREAEMDVLDNLLGRRSVRFVCILGVAASGKTTPAKLYYQADDENRLHRFGWVNLSIGRWGLKILLQELLLHLDSELLDVRIMSEIALLRGIQIESRRLIVLDGVWSVIFNFSQLESMRLLKTLRHSRDFKILI